MKKIIFLFFCVLVVLGWQYNPIANSTIVIPLQKDISTRFNLETNELGFANYLIPAVKYPKLNTAIKSNYRGIPIHDSIEYFIYYHDGVQFRYDLYKSKLYDKKDFLHDVKTFKIDTLKLSPLPVKQNLVAAVLFYKKKQIIVGDFNNNKDFSDDLQYQYSIHFRENAADSIATLSKLPIAKYYYEEYNNKSITKKVRNLILYPTINEPRITSDDIYNKLEYNTKCIFRDYWKGEYLVNNQKYDFYYQGLDQDRGSLFVKNKAIDFGTIEDLKMFAYYVKDTIAIEKSRFVLDSVNSSITKMYLHKVGEMKKNYGVTPGTYIQNTLVEEVHGGKVDVNTLFQIKKYTLIDFWNTHCEPCIVSMPKINSIKNKYKNKLSVISISNDKSLEIAQKAILKYQMNWMNLYSNPNSTTRLNNILRVTTLPTLFLVDRKGKIIYRGSSIEEVEKRIR